MIDPTSPLPTDASDVAAVIVAGSTPDRSDRCLEAVRAQVPAPDRIIGPTVSRRDGIAAALDSGARWLWCMDDSGDPTPGALAELLRQADRHGLDLVAPLVVAEEDHGEPAFALMGCRRVEPIQAAARDGILRGHADLFHGTLIRRHVLETIGTLRRGMTPWGEAEEFRRRALGHGVPLATAPAARHVHPRIQGHVRAGETVGTVRDLGFIHATYEPAAVVLRTMLARAVLHLVIRRGDAAGLTRFVRAYASGLFDRDGETASPLARGPEERRLSS